MEMLSLKIRHKRNRPPVVHIFQGLFWTEGLKLFFWAQRPQLMHTALAKLLIVQDLQNPGLPVGSNPASHP